MAGKNRRQLIDDALSKMSEAELSRFLSQARQANDNAEIQRSREAERRQELAGESLDDLTDQLNRLMRDPAKNMDRIRAIGEVQREKLVAHGQAAAQEQMANVIAGQIRSKTPLNFDYLAQQARLLGYSGNLVQLANSTAEQVLTEAQQSQAAQQQQAQAPKLTKDQLLNLLLESDDEGEGE